MILQAVHSEYRWLFHRHTFRWLSNLEMTIIVCLKVGSISRNVSSQMEEHHSTLLCWRNRTRRCGGLPSAFTIDWISSGVLSDSPLLACSKKTQYHQTADQRHPWGVRKSQLQLFVPWAQNLMMVRLGQWAYSVLMTDGFRWDCLWHV
jgi:hypothetical protein